MTNEQAVDSPCIGICVLDDQDVCIGCFRSRDEIAAWSLLSPREQREVLRRSQERESA